MKRICENTSITQQALEKKHKVHRSPNHNYNLYNLFIILCRNVLHLMLVINKTILI